MGQTENLSLKQSVMAAGGPGNSQSIPTLLVDPQVLALYPQVSLPISLRKGASFIELWLYFSFVLV